MTKRHVYLAQIANNFEKSVMLPYSAGCLQAFAQVDPEIVEHYDFTLLAIREPMSQLVSKIVEPDVLGLSCYVWNWEYSKTLAQRVKQLYPGCLIVMGGPMVPEQSWLESYKLPPYVDAVIDGEGELPFYSILRHRLEGTAIPKMTTWRHKDLSEPPSPYTAGVFDGLLTQDIDWQGVQETNRGCPYSCTFCDWGASVHSQIRAFPEERILAEYRWFADHKIEYIWNADANYGILPRDIKLTQALVDIARRTGYPKHFRTSCAKGSAKRAGERVFQISELLSRAGICRGVSMSLQSLSPEVLKNIKRTNMSLESFAANMARFKVAGIPTFTELVLPLPGETYDSFVTGIDRLLEAGQHGAIYVYPCAVYPNSEMATPEYREKHGIKTERVRRLGTHAMAGPDGIDEYEELVTATSAMPEEDLARAWEYAWIVQAFHSMGLTQLIANYLHTLHIRYSEFYRGFEASIGELARKRFQGWPPEEQLFLSVVQMRQAFYAILEKQLTGWIDAPAAAHLVKEQEKQLVGPEEYSSLDAYAREVVWYGRRTQKMLKQSGVRVCPK